MNKLMAACFLDMETNELVSVGTIRESWKTNMELDGIETCTLKEYLDMVTNLYFGCCARVIRLSDVVIHKTFGTAEFVSDVCMEDDFSSVYRPATWEDVK